MKSYFAFLRLPSLGCNLLEKYEHITQRVINASKLTICQVNRHVFYFFPVDYYKELAKYSAASTSKTAAIISRKGDRNDIIKIMYSFLLSTRKLKHHSKMKRLRNTTVTT